MLGSGMGSGRFVIKLMGTSGSRLSTKIAHSVSPFGKSHPHNLCCTRVRRACEAAILKIGGASMLRLT